MIMTTITTTYCESVCSLTAWNAHAPYCHMWPAPLYIIFTHYLIAIFEKIVTEHRMCVLISSAAFVWNISHWKKCIRNVYWSSFPRSRILSEQLTVPQPKAPHIFFYVTWMFNSVLTQVCQRSLFSYTEYNDIQTVQDHSWLKNKIRCSQKNDKTCNVITQHREI